MVSGQGSVGQGTGRADPSQLPDRQQEPVPAVPDRRRARQRQNRPDGAASAWWCSTARRAAPSTRAATTTSPTISWSASRRGERCMVLLTNSGVGQTHLPAPWCRRRWATRGALGVGVRPRPAGGSALGGDLRGQRLAQAGGDVAQGDARQRRGAAYFRRCRTPHAHGATWSPRTAASAPLVVSGAVRRSPLDEPGVGDVVVAARPCGGRRTPPPRRQGYGVGGLVDEDGENWCC